MIGTKYRVSIEASRTPQEAPGGSGARQGDGDDSSDSSGVDISKKGGRGEGTKRSLLY